MDLKTSVAAHGYARARSAATPVPTNSGSERGSVADMATSFLETLQNGEQTAKATMLGSADPHALVQALAQTQLAVETAVTVRNKVVEAYQEILRMQV